MDRLLDLEVECSQADKNLWTPLTYAAAGGHASCVRALLDAGAGAGEVDACGRTALHWAAERGWADVVSLLVPAMALEGRDVGLLVNMLSASLSLPASLSLSLSLSTPTGLICDDAQRKHCRDRALPERPLH